MRIAGLVVLLTTLSASHLHAQAKPYQATSAATAALRLASPSAPPRAALWHDTDLLVARRFNSRAPGATFMIIGGAAIVTGILVGGSGGFVLILGGVGLGAYGFYLYNR